jgi:hypothetical protein
VLGVLEHLRERHREKKEDLVAIAKARQEARRSGDEPEKTMADTVFETYDKYPDGGPP